MGENHLLPPRLDQITPRTLTTAADAYTRGELPDPHVDPIRPGSPLLAPSFSHDLKETAFSLRHAMPVPSTPGLVLLSGPNDTYVDAEKTKRFLTRSVPSFRAVQYSGALHEIDNEVPAISERAHQDILRFLGSR